MEESCTVLNCDLLTGYNARLTILPCNKPPGIRLVIHDLIGSTLIDETLVHSRTQPITFGGVYLFDLIINITHDAEPQQPAIILQVQLTISFMASELSVYIARVPSTAETSWLLYDMLAC